MEQIVIRHPDGELLPLFSKQHVSTVSKATQKVALLSDDLVAISLVSATPLSFGFGDTITLFGKPYKLNQLPTVTKDGERRYNYDLQFEGLQYDLIDVNFLLPEGSYGDYLYMDLAGHLDALIWNINRIFPNKWVLGTVPTGTETKNITVAGKNCLQVAQELCSEYGVEFAVSINEQTEKYVIDFKKEVGVTHDITLRYGRGGGLYRLARQNVNNAGLTTRLYVYGSGDNLGSGYRHTKLCLPTKNRINSYIEDATAIQQYGIKEGERNYDIKPQRVGHVTSLGANVITFADSTMFNLTQKNQDGSTVYLIDGTTAKITFQTGNLAGYSFDIHSYEHSTRTFVINKFKDENGLEFPSDTNAAFQIRAAEGSYPGDEYIIEDINLPAEYVTAAENELQEKGEAELAKLSQPQVSYKLYLDEAFFIKLWGREVAAEVLHVGDYITIQDTQIGVNKSLRIVRMERDLLRPHSYDITLSDTITKTTRIKVLNELQDINEIINIHGLGDAAKARRNWRTAQELLSMVFDPEGDYYSERIKPLSIDTTMLAVGAKSQQFVLKNITFAPNHQGDYTALLISNGTLVHYAIEEDIRTWTLTGGTFQLDTTSAYYIYASCSRFENTGTFLITTQQLKVDSDANTYRFLIGTISSPDTVNNRSVRSISLTYGFSTVNGRFIKTGRIESTAGTCYFDLDNNEIGGVLKFVKNDGTTGLVKDIDTKAEENKTYITSTLPGIISALTTQIDGKIETFYGTTDPATSWTTNEEKAKHVGDLWYNTETLETKRYNNLYAWQIVEDKDAKQAMRDAATAQDTADGKRRVFIATPTPPYDPGDLWVQGTSGDIMRCATQKLEGQSYAAADWVKASKYTGDENLNAFIATYNADVATINTKIDGKIETFYGTTDPATSWTTNEEKAKHVGDLWFNTTTHEAKRYTSQYSWELLQDKDAIDALAAAATAQDTADGKRRVFVSTPYPPYNVGDLWVQGTSGELMRCATERLTGNYKASDWVRATKYTGDENLNAFIATYNATIADIYNQLDGVIETWFYSGVPTLNNAPAVDWTTSDEKERHLGDLYYDNDDGLGYRFSKDNGVYKWVQVQDSATAAALAAAQAAQDTADHKRRVFVTTPYTPYDVGDLWASGTFLKRCTTARASGNYTATDWENATSYTGDENLNAFINGTFGQTISDIYNQIDSKVESWYSSTDPSTAWTTDDAKKAHIGDQWFNTSSNRLYYWKATYNGSTFVSAAWEEIKDADALAAATAASTAQDTADGKRRVFIATPTPPYDPGDLWVQGTSGDIMRCATQKLEGQSYAAADWVKASKYTGDENLTAFINGIFANTIEDLQNQIDGKLESWYSSTDPANDWATYDDKLAHLGDQWYNTSTHRLYRYNYTRLNGFQWEEITNADALAAAAAAAAAQDTADGKRRVFVSTQEHPTPYTPYDVGDLWTDGTDLYRCINARATGSYVATDWDKATNYTSDAALTAFINGTFQAEISELQEQIDGKIESWFQTSDPAAGWTTVTDKTKHLGDTWFDSNTNALKFYRNTGITLFKNLMPSRHSIWKGTAIPTIGTHPAVNWSSSEKYNHIGDLFYYANSRKVYYFSYNGTGFEWKEVTDVNTAYVSEAVLRQLTSGAKVWKDETPTVPYAINDVYITGNNVYVCNTARSTGSYNASEWTLAFSSVICWQQTSDQTAIDAYAAASQAQETADGKRRVFVSTPYPPYDIGDLWLTGNSTNGQLFRCVTARATGSYISTDWAEAVYYDNTQTIIDGGIVTAGTVQLANANSQSIVAGITGGETESASETEARKVRIWAGASKANRFTAPFRVLQDGSFVASKGDITGVIHAQSGDIGGIIIGGGWLGAAGYTEAGSEEEFSLSKNMICWSRQNCYVGIGDVISAASGTNNTAVMRVENERSNPYFANYGLMVKVSGGQRNYAMTANAPIKTSKWVHGYGFNIYIPPANSCKTLDDYAIDSNPFVILARYTNSNSGIGLPKRKTVADWLGIGYDTAFAVRITIIGHFESTYNGYIAGRNTVISGMNKDDDPYPYIRSNNGAWMNEKIGQGKGDVDEFELIYEGGGGSYNAYYVGHMN